MKYIRIMLILTLLLGVGLTALAIPKLTIQWKMLQELNVKTGQATDALKNLRGKLVRLPGYIVPLEGDDNTVSQFLLVPTLGACIHVPPPPPNQIVMVNMQQAISSDFMFFPVWVTGAFHIEQKTNEIAEAGFFMEGKEVEPYNSNNPF
ncbi:MAG: DUF3299 domain-containing protein [SAR324 cluster bacterium]|nr:DUF3299 domain-containing protein [SAR324 cluster bacterium]